MEACPWEWVIPQQEMDEVGLDPPKGSSGRSSKSTSNAHLGQSPEGNHIHSSAPLTCSNPPITCSRSLCCPVGSCPCSSAWHSDLVSSSPDHHSPQPFQNPLCSSAIFLLKPHTRVGSLLLLPQTTPLLFLFSQHSPQEPTVKSHCHQSPAMGLPLSCVILCASVTSSVKWEVGVAIIP